MSVLRLKPHLAAHVVSPEEVALLGEGGRFALRGKVYAAVVPLLDGKRSDESSWPACAESFSPELVYYALGELEAKGYVDRPPARGRGDAVGDAWWSGHDVAPEVVRRSSLSRTTGSSMPAPIARPWRPCGRRWGAASATRKARPTWW